MMKKWSKVGLLTAVTAFMLAALPAYSADGKTVSVTYDFATAFSPKFTTTDLKVNPKWEVPTAEPAANGVTFEWIATSNLKVKNNEKSLQVSRGSKTEPILKLTANEPIKVTVEFNYVNNVGAKFDPSKPRGLTVGDKTAPYTADSPNENTITCTAAKEVIIAANGVRITKITTAPAK